MTANSILALVPFGFHLPLPVIVLGAITGITYGLLGVGLVLVYRTSRVINFAQGQMGAFGAAFMGLASRRWHVPYYLALPMAFGVGGLTAGLTELAVVRRLRNAPKVMSIVATLGVGQFLLLFAAAFNPTGAAGAIFPSPAGLPEFQFGALRVTQAYMGMIVFGPIAVAGLTIFLRRSRYGLGIRCAAANPEAARRAGISANRMSSLAWVLSGVLSVLTTVLVLPAATFNQGTSFGPGLLLRALACAVIARMYSFPIALGSGVVLGIVEQLLLWNYRNSTGLVELVLLVLILAALLIQRGMQGREEEKGSWAAIASWPPLPGEVARQMEVRLLPWILGLGSVLIACLLPLAVSNSAAITLSSIMAFSIVGVSVGVVTGLGGQLSLGQFGVAAIGAVVSYHVSRQTSIGVGLIYAGLVGAALSLLIGLPALRLKGLMLTVTTLGFALVTASWALSQPWALGQGVSPHRPDIFGHTLRTGRSYYYFALGLLLVILVIANNVRRSELGRALRAVRDNEDNARAFTVSARKIKLQGFALAGFVAGIGGAVYGHLIASIDASTFPVSTSIDVVALTVIGGMSLLIGPVLGAFYIIGLPSFVPLDSAGLAATQLGWLALILYLPGGLAQVIEPLRDAYVRWVVSRRSIDVDASDRPPGGVRPALSSFTQLARRQVPTDDSLLVGHHLYKHFGGVVAVNDVSLQVKRGEIVGLIGPNGAGKTTTFELLSGFTHPDKGRVLFDGRDVSSLGPEGRGRLGLIRSFQDAALFPTLTVSETIRFAFEPSLPTRFFPSVVGLGGSERERARRARALIDVMGLGPYQRRQIQELSTGTRRITEIACMVALGPRLLLLDEPSSGVAQRETEALGRLLQRLRRELDLTMLIIEHDIPLIMSLSNRIITMDVGRVIAEGTPTEVRTDPKVVEAYLGGSLAAIQRSHDVEGGPADADESGSSKEGTVVSSTDRG